LKYLRPSTKDSDIPTRKTIRKYILTLAKDVEQTLRDKFRVRMLCYIMSLFKCSLKITQQTAGKHSISHDAWTSDSGIPFLNINDHYISAPPEQPNDWEIITEELAFMKIEGRHTGANLGSAILKTLDRYELRGKSGWITSDGASVNRSTARVVEQGLDNGWTALEHDMM
jgi:hypothetical protein